MVQFSDQGTELLDLHGLAEGAKVRIITNVSDFVGEVICSSGINDLPYSIHLRLDKGGVASIFVSQIVAVVR